jgi:hypothetical protein
LSVKNQDVRKQEKASSLANVKSLPSPPKEGFRARVLIIIKHLKTMAFLKPSFGGLGRPIIYNGK